MRRVKIFFSQKNTMLENSNWLITILAKIVGDFKKWDILEWHGISLKTFGIEATKGIGIA